MSQWIRSVLRDRSRVWAFALSSSLLSTSLFLACSSAPSDGVDPGGSGSTAAHCSTPDEGCPCDSVGLTAECGEVLSKSGGVVTCTVGKRTCDGAAWGTCVGDKTMFKSEAPITRAESRVEGLGQPGPCANNPCDPDCISIIDNGLGLDAGPGLFVNDAGGISLLGNDCGAGAAADSGACVCATTYTNVAPAATPTLSAGGALSPYQVTDSNDLVLEANNCSVWAWISAGNAPGGGQWLAYTWPSSKTIAKMHMDTASATVPSPCGVIGRTAGAAQVQWWDGTKWITDGTVSGKLDDWDYTFTVPVTTTQVRLFDMYATNTLGQQSNPIVFEWQVFEATTVCPNNCKPDGGAGAPAAGCAQSCVGFQCQVAQCPVNAPTTLTGVVLDPAGKNPIYNAYVYVPATLPLPVIPAGAQPDACGGGGNLPPAVTYALTGADGKFTLTGVPSGSIPLVVQVGKWRRQTTINVTSCVSAAVPPASTRLPKNHGEGNMPHIAITANGCDPMECLLTRIGIDAAEFKSPGAGGAVDYYLGDGIPLSGGSNPPPSTFMQSVSTLRPYDLVMLPCDCGTEFFNLGPWSFVGAPTYSALSQYLGGGGRLFASHYGRHWIENPFPGVASWAPDGSLFFGDPNVGIINQALPSGVNFAQWMSNIGAASGPGQFIITPTRYDTFSTTGLAKQVVTYKTGNVPADFTFDAPLNVPLSQQFGRGMYTDMHLAQGGLSFTFPQECPLSPLTAQEDAAEFLLFNLGGCITPLPPPAPGFAPTTFTRQFTAVCPAGKYVEWRDFVWQDAIPSNGSGTANVTFTVQTGDNAQSLGAVIPLAISTVSHPNWILTSVANALVGANQLPHPMLQVNMTLNPTPDKSLAPTLMAWQQTFDCVDSL